MRKLFKTDFVFFVIFLILTSFGLIFKNHINPSFVLNLLADSWGNILGTVTASFLFFSLRKEIHYRRRELIIVAVGTGFIIYELIQFILPWQTFDLKDIYGTFIGILLSTIINSVILSIRYLMEKFSGRKKVESA